MPSTASPSPALRQDIQGLRALAVLMVVTYHVWLGRVSGGVDVFLFLSAFFLTGGLVRRLERAERIDLPRHWLRVFQRLLPAAAVVVVGTVLAGLLLLPATRWRGLLVDATGSVTYVENWVLAHRAVDYYAADKGSASPLQHMWSLSLQGQVFLGWPVLVLLLAALARQLARVSLRTVLWFGLGALTLASFTYSVHVTATRQTFAYFDGGARLWEFGLGGLLALAVTRIRLPGAVAVPLGWVGLAGLLSCGLVLDVTRSFPGWAALWPLLSAGAVVLAGTAPNRWGVGRALSVRPLVAAGGISYALYLVHWPVLVLWLSTAHRERAGALDGAAVVLVSVVLAQALSRLVERPLRAVPWPQVAPLRSAALVLGAAALVAGVAVTGILRMDAAAARGTVLSSGSVVANYPGARAVGGAVPVEPVAVQDRLPAVTALRQEFASLPARCHGPWADETLGAACTQLEPTHRAAATVVVVGDSHAEQWLAAVLPLARENGWRVVALLKGACSFGDPATPHGRLRGLQRDGDELPAQPAGRPRADRRHRGPPEHGRRAAGHRLRPGRGCTDGSRRPGRGAARQPPVHLGGRRVRPGERRPRLHPAGVREARSDEPGPGAGCRAGLHLGRPHRPGLPERVVRALGGERLGLPRRQPPHPLVRRDPGTGPGCAAARCGRLAGPDHVRRRAPARRVSRARGPEALRR